MQRPLDQFFDNLKGLRAHVVKSWNAQATAVLILFGITALALVSIQRGNSKESLTVLFEDRSLTSAEAESIEAAMGDALLTDYVFENGTFRVPIEKRGQYLAAISDAKALPQSFHAPTQEAINNGSLIETSRTRSQRLHFALEKEARLAICELPGVLDASVHIDVATDRSIRMKTQTTAAVGVKTSREMPLNEQSFRTVHAMLLNFKAGLTPEAVTITDLTTGQFFIGAMDNQSPEAMASLRKRDLERFWRQKLSSAISFVNDAKLAVQVVSTDDGRDAHSVYCSISVPRDANASEALATKTQSETAIRHRIQSALLPLIPHNNKNADEVIAVNVFERVVAAKPSLAMSWLSPSPNLIAGILVGIAGVMVLFLLKGPVRPPIIESPAPTLRIYEGQAAGGAADSGVVPSEQLQTIAAEDPDAVADSLSNFIDQAS